VHKNFLLTIYIRTYVCSRMRNEIEIEKYIEDKTLLKIIKMLSIIFDNYIDKTKRTINVDLNK